ncbi:MAG: SUMF1/EgtB/PvdO family nonheme iron enzyme [Planctomycetales bacterium]
MLWIAAILITLSGCGGGSTPQRTPGVQASPPQAPAAPPLVHNEPAPGPGTNSPQDPTAVAEKPKDPAEGTSGEKDTAAPLIHEERFVVKGEEQWKVTGNVPLQEPFLAVARTDRDSTQLEILGAESPSSSFIPGPRVAQKTLPKNAQPIPNSGWSPDGFPLRITYGVNDPCEMALIPAGTYHRGTDHGPDDARPEQSVTLEAFYMDVTEVTVAQYERMREANQKGSRPLPQPSNALADPRQPAVGISYGDALFYAKWAGKDLPSEAQWEAAARGPQGYRYVWGNGRVVWEKQRARNQLDPVGSFRSDISPFGILDLTGNAREWCKDKYSPTSYAEQAGHGLLRDPVFNGRSVPTGHQAVRGNGEDWSAWCRGHASGSDRVGGIGLRCVLRLSPGGDTPVREAPSAREPGEKRPAGTPARPAPKETKDVGF